jgi:predicted DsbA family dithiol-disulfide isomerase
MRAGGQGHVVDRVGAGHVGLERLHGSAVARDLLRGEMHDRVAVAEHALQRAPVTAVLLVEAEGVEGERRLDVRQRAVRQVIDTDDLTALGQQTLTQV